MRIADQRGNSLSIGMRRQIILIALDVSGSMSTEGRLSSAIAGVKTILNSLNENDMVALMTFNDSVHNVSGGIIACTDRNKRALIQKLDRLSASNQTAFYDAVLAVTALVLKMSEEAKKLGHLAGALGADGDLGHFHLVFLTDGDDNKSRHKEEEVGAILMMLGMVGVEYNTLWVGVKLSREAEKKLLTFDAVGGRKSSYVRCQDSAQITSKFQEVAIKIRTTRQAMSA